MTISIANLNASPPSDGGEQTEANKMYWQTIEDKVITPLSEFLGEWKEVGADIASGATLGVNIDGQFHDVSGTATITAFAATSGDTSKIKVLQFDGILILTHHATDLVLPGGSNITTAAGDIAVFYEYASGDWRCVSYQRAAQSPISYEEGSFSPTLIDDTLGDGSSEGQTYTTQVGRYTKVGRLVTFQLTLTVDSLGTLNTSGHAAIRMNGLPTSDNSANQNGGAACAFYNSTNLTSAGLPTGRIPPNTNYILLYEPTGVSGATTLLISEYSAGGSVSLHGSYIV